MELAKRINMAELRKLRRQFISYSKMHPIENTAQIANMFVQYLNKSYHWIFLSYVFFYSFLYLSVKNKYSYAQTAVWDFFSLFDDL